MVADTCKIATAKSTTFTPVDFTLEDCYGVVEEYDNRCIDIPLQSYTAPVPIKQGTAGHGEARHGLARQGKDFLQTYKERIPKR